MNQLRLFWRTMVVATIMVCVPGVCQAAILFGSDTRNTTEPDGALAGSGWQYQGQWSGFLGTAISPNHFISAGHIGGSVGGSFSYQGTNYVTTAFFDDPNSDLRIWEIDGEFGSFAPLYTASDEVGQDVVLFGRGTQRGDAVEVNGQLKGWRWGTLDRVQSWGTNTVTQVVSENGNNPGVGDLLSFAFDANAAPNEAQLSEGDSGGGVFINDNGTWKLAAINFAVSGPFRLTADGESFNAAVFDQGGLFIQDLNQNWVQVPDQPFDLPGFSSATRISSNLGWIQSVIPEPSTAMILAGGSIVALGRRRSH